MAFVNVGNAGNPADTTVMGDDTTGYGAVGYAYRIGTYDVTAAQWAAVYAADPNVGSAAYWSGSQPAAGMTWNQAAEFCNWLTTGNALSGYYSISGGSATPNALSHDAYAALHGTTYFLPTENEWYKAAFYSGSGSTYYQYATGSNTVPTAVYSGTAAGTAVFYGNGVSPTAPAAVDEAGGLSPYGTMGQDGNVWQWNETAIGSYRGLRGGRWDYNSNSLASSYRSDLNPANENNNIGFRVASSEAVPEPGSITLLIAGAIAVLIGWKRWR
jgi:formylglycine-generating enzyme required for sulfatase activity